MHRNNIIKSTQIDTIEVEIYSTALSVGEAAALYVSNKMNQYLEEEENVNIVFATGASQFTFLDALKTESPVDWSRVTVFLLDEYVGLSENHPASFRKYLRQRILDEVNPGRIYFLNGDANDITAEIQRYVDLLKLHPIDIACLGIGENGHLALIDPHIADFDDPEIVKIVQLDNVSRMQQVKEGWFNSIEDVPREAVSLTIPAIMQARTISCVVPEERKAEPVYRTLYGEISPDCPASILRKHHDVKLFLDRFSAEKLK